MRSALALAAGALAGCHLLYPLEVEQLSPDATVSGTYIERIVRNTESGPVVTVQSARDAVVLRARFVVDSEVTLIDVPIDGDGNFSIQRLSVDYSLESTFPTSLEAAVPIELFEDQPVVHLTLSRAGREGAEITSEVPVLMPTPTLPRNLVSIGQYSNTNVTNLSVLDWRDTRPTGGLEVGLLDATQHDALFILDYGENQFNDNMLAVSGLGVAPNSTMTSGQMLDLSAINMVPTDFADGCVAVDLDLTSSLARLAAAAKEVDPDFSEPTGGMAVMSVPAVETGLVGAVTLVETLPFTSDFVVRDSVEYADPFPTHDLFLTAFAQSGRTVTVGPATLPLGFGFAETRPVDRGTCPATSSALPPIDIAYASDFTIDGQALNVDDVPVEVPRTGSVTVSWNAVGIADFFDVTLIEVDEAVPRLRARRVFRTRTPQITIDNTYLEPGRAYVLVVAATVGFPDAGTGDYANARYPSMTSGATSALFRPN